MRDLTDEILILAQGEGWLAVEKPAGVSTHNAPGHDMVSLVASKLAREGGPNTAGGVYPVHRLDIETGGVLLLATRPETAQTLGRQFSGQETEKHYLALVHGAPAAKARWNAWQWPLSKSAGGRRDIQGRAPRQSATTRYTLRQRHDVMSLLECHLLTGRKHQIRRHAALAGCPVMGDRRYAPKSLLAREKIINPDQCFGLYAMQLTFTAPETRARITVHGRRLPKFLPGWFMGQWADDGSPL